MSGNIIRKIDENGEMIEGCPKITGHFAGELCLVIDDNDVYLHKGDYILFSHYDLFINKTYKIVEAIGGNVFRVEEFVNN